MDCKRDGRGDAKSEGRAVGRDEEEQAWTWPWLAIRQGLPSPAREVRLHFAPPGNGGTQGWGRALGTGAQQGLQLQRRSGDKRRVESRGHRQVPAGAGQLGQAAWRSWASRVNLGIAGRQDHWDFLLEFYFSKPNLGTSLTVRWLRLRTSTVGGTGLIPGLRSHMPHSTAKKKEKFDSKSSTNY